MSDYDEHDTPSYRAELLRYSIEATVMRMDASLYPHIFQRILQFSSSRTLQSALRCSKKSFELASAILYHRLDLSTREFYRFTAVVRRRLVKPTPSFTTCLARVSHFHFSIDKDKVDWPTLKRDMPNLRTLQVYHSNGDSTVNISSAVDWSKALDHVIIRCSTANFVDYKPTKGPARKDMPTIPKKARRITLITHDTLFNDESIFMWPEEAAKLKSTGRAGDTLTVVYLPYNFLGSRYHFKWQNRYPKILHQIARWRELSPKGAKLEIVGLEYGQGQSQGTIKESTWVEACRPRNAAKAGKLASVRFRTFEAWQAAQEPGVMFDAADDLRFMELAATLRLKWEGKEWKYDPNLVEEEEPPEYDFDDY